MGGFGYPYQYEFEMDIIPEATGFGALGVFLVLYLLIMFFTTAFSLVCYVLQSYGLYTIANRRGIRNSWLAWVPVGNMWILGSISDQYQYVAKGKVKNRRKLLLGLNIGLVVATVGWFIAILASALMSESVANGVITFALIMLLGYLAFLTMVVIATVYMYLCCYDLYNSCNPSNGVLFLVLSIIFSVTLPFFIFACRKKDLGMPPKKKPAPQPVIEIVAEEPAEEPVTEEGYAQPEEFEEE
jgi:hypothetical protein